mmetsp:Transcript_19329/g.45692  ORF Transcript_19329/g.45692 Transcript_19329/m.45692 type:complete len:912 (-) Transcript_19329:115-2850(-)
MNHPSRERTRSWTGFHRSSVGNSAVEHSPPMARGVPKREEEDGELLPPASPAGTPPKKIWEQKYRTFLHQKPRGGSPSEDSLDSKTFIPPKSSSSAGRPQFATTHISRRRGVSGPTLFAKDREAAKKNGEDSSVRGGKLFSNMFRRDRDGHYTDDSTSSRCSKKSSSTDELDGTMRRGVEKSYSPSTPKPRVIEPNVIVTGSLGLPLRSGSAPSGFHPPLKQSSAPGLTSRIVTGRGGLVSPRVRSAHNLSPSSVQIDESSGWIISEPLGTKLPQQRQPREFEINNNNNMPLPPMPLTNPEIPMPDPLQQRTSSGVSVVEEPDENDMPTVWSINTDLDASSRKKKFTEFHNEHQSESPFLGDDSSNHSKSAALWTSPKGKLPTHTSLGGLQNLLPRQASLEPVPENIEYTKDRTLRAFVAVDQWQTGRRYLIGPAAFEACPMQTSRSVLFGNPLNNNGEHVPVSAPDAAASRSIARSVVLGNCLLSDASAGKTSATTAKTWSRASLFLYQNYLLEYDQDAVNSSSSSQEFKARPRGYAHLEGAVARPHPDFADAVELDFFGSPCARSDYRSLIIRLAERSQRDAWVTCFNRAGSMQLLDLYEMDNSEPVLGEGTYSTVHRASLRHEASNERVALKIFDKAAFWKLVVKGRERADTLVRETAVQATLTAKYGNIGSFLRLQNFFETSNHVVLELEILNGLDLFHYITMKGVVSEPEAARIVSDILKCLVAMNDIGAAHRDIKPANVLMCQSHQPGDGPSVKVCDFGMSTFVGVDGQVRGRCGTPGYVAPEIFTTGLHGGYGNTVDVYSAGVTLYVMLCGYEPFYGETDEELVDANTASNVEFAKEDWKRVSEEARNLVEMLMEKDTSKRPSARDALLHPFFEKHAETALTISAPSSGCEENNHRSDSSCVVT